MANSLVLRKDAERRFYMTHTTGVSQQTPYGMLKRMYYIQYIAGSQPITTTTSLNDLKIMWMRKYCAAAGVPFPSQNFESDAWKAMVSAVHQRPVSSTATNIMNFFLNAP